MKKITYLLSIALFASCGAPNENKEKNNVEKEVQTQVAETEKNWEEFTIGAVGNTMSEMKYDVSNITVSEGSWVRITLVNEGVDLAMLHNIVFVNYGTRKEVATEAITAGSAAKYVPNNSNVIAASDLANPGETITLEFEAPKKGNYEFICTYPGHSEIMSGYFFVK